MTHYDEDIYKLEQMKQLASDMYNARVNEKPVDKINGDKYAYHIGETIRSLDNAITERKAEEEKSADATPAAYTGNFPIQSCQEENSSQSADTVPLYSNGKYVCDVPRGTHVFVFDEDGILTPCEEDCV